jgi:DNA gyrase subunit A
MAQDYTNQSKPLPLGGHGLGAGIRPIDIEIEMRKSYLDYAMSVIIGRALPDVRDGLKPVQRRILYAMREDGLRSNRPPRKCARIVGQVMGKYHPHGDASIYDTLVRMAQPFSMRVLLVNGQGNFGSVDGDPPAAMRYTEARLAPYAEVLLEDIAMDTVDFRPNYDDSAEEPECLAAAAPNLLANGSDGIAVGMATHIPPHNLAELIDAAIQLIRHPHTRFERIVSIVQGPDFPTGGILCGRAGILQAYREGRGHIVVRARTEFEQIAKNRHAIIVNELPYQVNKARLIKKAADLVNHKKITGISDIRDESDRKGMRIVFDLKRGEHPEVMLNNLYKHTDLQHGAGVAMLAIVDARPKVLGLVEYLKLFIRHRQDVVRRRTNFLLRKARDREHVLLGFSKALQRIDEVIALIRASRNPKEAKLGLMGETVIDYSEFLREHALVHDLPFDFTERQAQAIIELQLQRLTSMERQKILDELEQLQEKIAGYLEILDSETVLNKLIISELRALKKKFGSERRTEIGEEAHYISIEDLIANEDMVVTVTKNGYLKRTALDTYRKQSRGGRGRRGMSTRDGDFLESLFVARTHSYILVFTNLGRVYWLKIYNIPEVAAAGRGRNIVNLLNFMPDETVQAFLPVRSFQTGEFIAMVTRRGTIKKCSLEVFSRPMSRGIIALKLREGDELVSARLCGPRRNMFLATHKGLAVHFSNTEVRAMGRTAMGVRGIRLDGEDSVIGMLCPSIDNLVLTITEYGFGKRTDLGKYRVTGRGGKGVFNTKITRIRGKVVSVMEVMVNSEVMIVTRNGKIVRFGSEQIRPTQRWSQGVRVVKLQAGDAVAAAVVLPRAEQIESSTAEVEATSPTLPIQ